MSASLYVTAFVASILGSLHCVGMCGPLAALAAGPGAACSGAARAASHAAAQFAYHAARLCVYAALGMMAGAIGSAMNLGGTLLGLQRAAGWVAGGALILVGGATLAGLFGRRKRSDAGRAGSTRFVQLTVRAASLAQRSKLRPAIFGFLTVLLPCGWLYVFVLAAAGTGSPLRGGVLMLAFWAGTLPVLMAATALAGLFGRIPARNVRIAFALFLFTLGTLTVFHRWNLPAVSAWEDRAQDPARIAIPSVADAPCCVRDGH